MATASLPQQYLFKIMLHFGHLMECFLGFGTEKENDLGPARAVDQCNYPFEKATGRFYLILKNIARIANAVQVTI